MKKITLFSAIAIFSFSSISNTLDAQVGINTKNPQRTLDVNGKLRIRNTEYKNADPNYSKVLVTNANGEIETWEKSEVKAEMKELAVETKKMYFSSSPDGTVIVPCGKIELRFNSSTQPEIRRVNTSTTATRLYFTRIRMKATNNKAVTSNTSVNIASNNGWQRIDNTSNGANYDLNNKDEYYLSYPGDSNLYRITFLARKMSSTANSYTMICEKF